MAMTTGTASRITFIGMRQTLVALAFAAGGSALALAQIGGVPAASGAANARPEGGVVFTADERGQSISVIDPASSKIETIRVGISPHNIQASSDGTMLFAVGVPAGEDHDMPAAMGIRGRLLILNATAVSRGPVADIEVGHMPAHVIVDKPGARAFVTNGGDNAVSVIDLAARQVVKSIAVGSLPHGLRMSPDGRTIYVANTGDGTVSVVSVDDLAETARIPVGNGPVQVAFTPDGRRSYVTLRDENSTAIIDTASRQVIAKVQVGPGPIQVFAAPSGREVYVANQGTKAAPGNTVSVIDTASQAAVAEIVTGAGAHGVVVSTNGDRVFIANTFADTMSVIDPAIRRVVLSIPVGAGPGGITFIPAKQ